MRRRRKLILAASSLLGLVLAVGWWSKHSPWLSARLREPIRAALSSASGRPVTLGGVGGGLSGWIWLQDVGIGPDPAGREVDVSVTAKAIGLRFGLLSLLNRRTELSDLKALRVEEPKLYFLRQPSPEGLSPTAGRSEDWRKAMQGLPLPALRLDLRDGEAYDAVRGAPPVRVLSALRAGLEPDKDGWRLRGQSDLELGGRVGLWGRSRADLSGAQLKARVSALPLSVWAGRVGLPARFSVSEGQLSGDLDLSQSADGAWSSKGKGELSGARFLIGSRVAVDQLESRWTWDGTTVKAEAIRGQSAGGLLEGRLDWGAGALHGALKLHKAELAQLAAVGGAPHGLSLSGKAEAEWRSQAGVGPNGWALSLRAGSAAWAGQALQRLELRGQAQGLSIAADVDLAWPGGQGRAQLQWGPQGWESASVEGQALPAAWLDPWAPRPLSGRLDLHGRLRFLKDDEPWELSASSAKLGMGALQLDRAQLTASGSRRRAQARVEGDMGPWKGVNASVDAVAQGGAWELSHVRVFGKDRLWADATGQWEPGEWSLRLAKGEWPAGTLSPWLPHALGALSGTVQARGDLRWTGGQGSGDLRLDAPQLSVAGRPMPFASRLLFSASGVSLSAMDLRRGELSGLVSAPRWTGPWSADLHLGSAQASAWAGLAGAPASLSGTVDGRLALQGSEALQADLQWHEPWPEALPGAQLRLDIRRQGSRWDLKRLDLQQGQGSLSASGSVDLAQTAAWIGTARWDGLRLRGGLWQGEARLEPGRSAAKLAVGPWSISGTALPLMSAELGLVEGRLAQVQARLGIATTVEARQAAGAWSLRASLDAQDPSELLGPWTSRSERSGLPLSGWIEAHWGEAGASQWSLALKDADRVNSRLDAQGVFGDGPLREAHWTDWDLQRLSGALKRLGRYEGPELKGRSSGAASGSADGVSVSAKAEGFAFGDVDFGPAELQAWTGNGAWSLSDLHAGGTEARLKLSDWHGQSRPGAWDARGAVSVGDWPLALFKLSGQGELELQGGDGKGALRSQWSDFSVNARRFQKLGLGLEWADGGFKLADLAPKPGLRASFSLQQGGFELQDLQAVSGKGRASLKGRVGADGSLQFDGTAQAFPAGDLTACLDWPQAWTGGAYGSLKLSGASGRVHGVISAKIEDGSVAGLPFDLCTGLVYLEPGWVQLSPLRPIRLSRRGGVALEVSGKVPLETAPGEVPTGMQVDAELIGGGLDLLSGSPLVESASGPLQLALHFRGRRDDPEVTGHAKVSGGKLTPAWLLPPLEKVDLYAQVEGGQLVLQKAEAQVEGDGPLLKLETAISTRPAFVFERWLPSALNLRLRASRSGIPLRSTKALAFIDGQAHPDLRLSGTWSAPVLEGEISLDKGRQEKALVQWPPRFADPGSGEGGGFLDELRYSLKLVARQDVMVRTEAAQVFVDSGEAGLRLSGAGKDRELEGHLTFTKGSIDYLLASFQLAADKDTYLDFRRDSPPELELWGLKRVRDAVLSGETQRRDVDVRLHAYGPIGEVQMRLESDDGGLDQQQLASLTGLGVDASDPRSQGGFARLLGKVPARFLTSLVRRTGIVDDVGVRLPAVEDALAGPRGTPVPGDPNSQGVSGTGRTLVSIDAGKYLSEKLYVGVTGSINERNAANGNGTEVDPALGGKVEYQLKDSSLVSAQHSVATDGQTEQRVMVERSARFENYNPRRRRWDAELSPTPTPRPTPSPTPTAVSR